MSEEPYTKVIMRLIYGDHPSGNQAEFAIREVVKFAVMNILELQK